MNTTQLWVLGTGIVILLALLGLGFAAMSTNLRFKVPTWLPRVFFALAIAVVSVEGFYFWHVFTAARIIAVIGDVGLLIYLCLPLRKRTVKGRKGSMLLGLGIFLIVAGIVGGSFLIESQSSIRTTIVRCCIEGNTYHIWATNPPSNDKDTVFISLGTSSLITNIEALMGASLPTIIEGGVNANFITFKITELPPNVTLGYIIEVGYSAETPRNFTAWSETTKNSITVIFTGQCPTWKFGPEETAPNIS
jgi:hypothetical protein